MRYASLYEWGARREVFRTYGKEHMGHKDHTERTGHTEQTQGQAWAKAKTCA